MYVYYLNTILYVLNCIAREDVALFRLTCSGETRKRRSQLTFRYHFLSLLSIVSVDQLMYTSHRESYVTVLLWRESRVISRDYQPRDKATCLTHFASFSSSFLRKYSFPFRFFFFYTIFGIWKNFSATDTICILRYLLSFAEIVTRNGVSFFAVLTSVIFFFRTGQHLGDKVRDTSNELQNFVADRSRLLCEETKPAGAAIEWVACVLLPSPPLPPY